jgi:hypothetical protein
MIRRLVLLYASSIATGAAVMLGFLRLGDPVEAGLLAGLAMSWVVGSQVWRLV